MQKWLEGKKTHIAAALGIAAAVGLLWLGFITVDTATEIIVACLIAMGFRSALAGPLVHKIAEAVAERAAEARKAPTQEPSEK